MRDHCRGGRGLFSGLGRRWGLKNGGRWRGVTPQLSGDETRQAVEQHGEDGLIWGAGRQVDLDLPVSSVPARRRLLALMADAPRHAQNTRCGASCSSTPCGCAWSNSPPEGLKANFARFIDERQQASGGPL
jgi:hypothetical protein